MAWTRIIYPDASSLDLGRMPGADEGGYAGFKDQVNNHVWKIWSNAILLSAFSAGIQLSQGNGNNQTSGGL
ncbi:TrbI/VirB10 family protein, partial [Rhodomicrobium sp.]|uniref:TrbI/VirB10 family protein n=1 Tax=Rhodomicrobium sp. TaxID=2720632 RepID=UPI0039E2F971